MRVAEDERLVGTGADHFWFQRGEWAGSASLHVHLQLQQDLQGVGHLCLTAGGGQEASAAAITHGHKSWMTIFHILVRPTSQIQQMSSLPNTLFAVHCRQQPQYSCVVQKCIFITSF